MSVKVNLSVEAETALAREAALAGTGLPGYLARLLEQAALAAGGLPGAEEQRERNRAALDLLDAWDREDATDDPEKLAARTEEWQDFKDGMNASHSSERMIYP